MDIEHSGYRENIPAYALGALDAGDAAALELHLRSCEACRAELASYGRVSEGMLAALPPQEPPADLRRRLKNSIPGSVPNKRAARVRPTWSFGQLAMGLVVLLLLGLNLVSFLQLRELQQGQAELMKQVQTDQAALSMLAYHGTLSIPIESEQASGTLLINKEENMAMLIAWDLPPLPAEQTYQAWLVQPDGIRVSGAVFRPEQGQAYTAGIITAPQSLNTFSSIGVTVEPAGGSTQPTGERVLKVDF
jgi:anti-sigma-K factor RskA